jgi:hypothetical protein
LVQALVQGFSTQAVLPLPALPLQPKATNNNMAVQMVIMVFIG